MKFKGAEKYITNLATLEDRNITERTKLLLSKLGEPQNRLKFIKIYGEAGKSTTAHLLTQILTAAKHRVGTLYLPLCSPLTNCLSVNRSPVSMDIFTRCVNEVSGAVSEIRSSHSDFNVGKDEILLSAAILAFEKTGCDTAIIEVSSNFKYSAASAVNSVVAVITSVFSCEIANNICAAIGSNDGDIVSAIQNDAVSQIISKRATEIDLKLLTLSMDSFYKLRSSVNSMRFIYNNTEYRASSSASHNVFNYLTVIEVCNTLTRHKFKILPVNISSAFISPLYKGNFEILSVEPYIILNYATTVTHLSAIRQAISDIGTENITILCEESDMLMDIRNMFSDAHIVTCGINDIDREVKKLLKELEGSSKLLAVGRMELIDRARRAVKIAKV